MLTNIEISDEMYELLRDEASKRGLTTDLLFERMVRLGMLAEQMLSEDEIQMILDGTARIMVIYEKEITDG